NDVPVPDLGRRKGRRHQDPAITVGPGDVVTDDTPLAAETGLRLDPDGIRGIRSRSEVVVRDDGVEAVLPELDRRIPGALDLVPDHDVGAARISRRCDGYGYVVPDEYAAHDHLSAAPLLRENRVRGESRRVGEQAIPDHVGRGIGPDGVLDPDIGVGRAKAPEDTVLDDRRTVAIQLDPHVIVPE